MSSISYIIFGLATAFPIFFMSRLYLYTVQDMESIEKKRFVVHICHNAHTAKAQYGIFVTNIPRKVIVRPQSQFPNSCVCELFIIPRIGLPVLLQENMWTDSGNIDVNRSQTQESGNLD